MIGKIKRFLVKIMPMWQQVITTCVVGNLGEQ